MSQDINPTCCLIGSSTLLVKCANLLLKSEWKIQLIYSSDEVVIQWCFENNIKCIAEQKRFETALFQTRYDYLFSIVNPIVLDLEILNTPSKYAINYHNSLLPTYAGMYATFWAVYNGEKQHGVSWHIMEEGIDVGPILNQQKFEILSNDTSISLNLKCYEAASLGFETLIEQITNDKTGTTKQNIKQRTYHSLYQRPQNACLLDFNQTAERIIQQWQAFQFGEAYQNKIGSPKVLVNNTFYIVSKIKDSGIKSNLESNLIYSYSEIGIFVTTNDKVLEIELQTLDGENVEYNNLQLQSGIAINSIETRTSTLSETYIKAIKSEKYWVRKLQNINYISFPFVFKSLDSTKGSSKLEFDFSDIKLPILTQNYLPELQHLALLILFMSRISDQYKFDLPMFENNSKHFNLFNAVKPCSIKINGNDSVQSCFETICKQLLFSEKKGAIVNDIVYRYPILKNNFSSDLLQKFECSFSYGFQALEKVESKWHLNINSNDLKGIILFPNHVFNQKIATQFIYNFKTFLQGLNPATNLIESKVLTDAEIEDIVVKQNQNSIDIPNETCIHELFENQAKLIPNNVAIIDSMSQLSYHDLNRKSNHLAQTITNFNSNSGNKIGILLPRSNKYIIAMLAILKTGNCYVPLSSDFPKERLLFMIQDCGIELIISEPKLSQKFDFNNVDIIDIDSLKPATKKIKLPQTTTNNLAYVIYTSGSSGQPKGVPITHFNAVNFLYSIRSVLQPKQKRIGAVTAPFNFDVSVEEIFSTICFGGTAHIFSQELLLNPKKMVDYLFEHQINTIFITPMLLPKIAEEFTTDTIQHLTHVLSGVQVKKNAVFKKLKLLSQNLKIFNTYGPTEVTFGPTAYKYKGTEIDDDETPIGKALPNYSLFVLNQNHQIQPNFVIGELFIGGSSLSPGYLNLPETNQRKFIQLPYGDSRPKYTSGDHVYRDAENNLHFVGRKDNQVKIRGFRIETSEIENVLQQHQSIELAIVRTSKIQETHQQLVAYLKFYPNLSVSNQNIKSFLEKKLPSYCIPSFFITIESVPIYPSGKINSHLLPDVTQAIISKKIKKPINKIEAEILKIWKQVLNQTQVSTDDNFFEIGGDSLSAVSVISKLQECNFNEVSLAMFYNFKTIQTFSKALNKNVTQNANNPLTLIRNGIQEQPIFFIHGLNGSIAVMQHIIDAFQTNQTLYAFQAGSNYQDYKSLQEVAHAYVECIIELDIKQCTLCGFSFGGILAFEMTRQLNENNIHVKLIQFDSKPIILFKTQKPTFYKLLYVSKVLKWLVLGKNKLNIKLVRIGKRIRKLNPTLIPQSNDALNIYQKTLIKSRQLANSYKYEKQKIDMVLFKATKEKEGFIGFSLPKNGWTYFTDGNVKIISIAIHHYDFDKPEHATKISDLILQNLKSK